MVHFALFKLHLKNKLIILSQTISPVVSQTKQKCDWLCLEHLLYTIVRSPTPHIMFDYSALYDLHIFVSL